MLLLPVPGTPAPGDSNVEAPKGIVDCLLPGPLRRIGGSFYQMPQRPARITASECTIRGGDFLLYDRANYETSLKFWITQAESGSGDADAMLYVGEIYEQGIGRDPDYATAADWYRKSADAGNATAMISLAHLYKTGQGVQLDLEAAQALYSQAFGSEVPIPLDPTAVKGADQRIETLVAEVDEVRRQKIAVELELQAASEQLANANRALDSALAGDSDESDLIRELQASIARQKSTIAAYESNLDHIKAENAELASLRTQLEQQTIEAARLRDLLAAAEAKVHDNREQLTAQQDALNAGQAEFNELLASAGADRESLVARSDELTAQRDRISALETSLRKAEDDRALYQALASDASTKEERVATLTARISLLEQQSNNVENQFAELRRDLAGAQSQLDVQVRLATEGAQLSASEITARDAEIQRLRASISRGEQEISRHQSDIDRLGQHSSELEQLRADLEREQAQSNRLQQLLTDSQDRFADSNIRLEEVNAARATLQEEIAALRADAASGNQSSQSLLQQRESELSTASHELETLQEQIAASEDEFGRYQQQMTDTASRQKQAIDNLRVAVAESRAEREQLEEKLASANQQIDSAQADLDFERNRYTELQDRLREARAQGEAGGVALQAKQGKLDQQIQQVTMLQQEIDRLNEQSNRYAAQINDLQARAQARKIDFAGPRIVMLEPSENLLGDPAMGTRGDDLQTRGISVVAANRLSETKIIRGHVEAPGGLAQLTIDGWEIAFDEHNSFTQSLKLNSETKHIRIVAVDHNGKQAVKEFEYKIDGTMTGTAKIYNKGSRFTESRNDALDHLSYYALIIANQNYENKFLRDLDTPISDAVAIGEILRDRYGFTVDILRDADKDEIETAFERIFYIEENDDSEENDKDAILIYYAGHGFVSDSRTNDAYFWAPVDAEFDRPRTWFKTREIESYMQVSETKQIMVVADSCFAGNVLSRDGLSANFVSEKSRAWRKFLTEYTQKKKSRYVLTSGGFAPVLDGGGGDHSVFARAFLDVLMGNNEIMSATRIHEQVAPRVMSLAERQNFDQTPLFGYLRSGGHAFGNFYLPAPLYEGQVAKVIGNRPSSTGAVVAQVPPQSR